MAKDRCENPRVDPRLDYVLKNRDRDTWVCRLTPVTDSPKFSEALKLSGNWLANTCWSWTIFYEPIEYNQARAKWGKSVEYPDQTQGSIWAAEVRKKASKLTQQQRAKYFKKAMQIIKSQKPKHAKRSRARNSRP